MPTVINSIPLFRLWTPAELEYSTSTAQLEALADHEQVKAMNAYSHLKRLGYGVESSHIADTNKGVYLVNLMYRAELPTDTDVSARPYTQPDPGYDAQAYVFSNLMDKLREKLAEVDGAIKHENKPLARSQMKRLTAQIEFVKRVTGGAYENTLDAFILEALERDLAIGNMPAAPSVPTYNNDDLTATLYEYIHMLDNTIERKERRQAYELAQQISSMYSFVSALTGGNWQVGQSGFHSRLQERYERIADLPTSDEQPPAAAAVTFTRAADVVRAFIAIANRYLDIGDTGRASDIIDNIGGAYALATELFQVGVADERQKLAAEIGDLRQRYYNNAS